MSSSFLLSSSFNLLLTDSDWSMSNTPSDDIEVFLIFNLASVELLMISSERVSALAEVIRGLL